MRHGGRRQFKKIKKKPRGRETSKSLHRQERQELKGQYNEIHKYKRCIWQATMIGQRTTEDWVDSGARETKEGK